MGKDNGGSAFPFEGGDNNNHQPTYGMTLRDYFAAKVVQALIANPKNGGTFDFMARAAYEQADAMLKERAK